MNALQERVFAYGAEHSELLTSRSIFGSMRDCHTIKNGYHLSQCNHKDCGKLHYQYHSCGNRHCMHCGGLKTKQWLKEMTEELLPTSYYHVVFTLPHELNGLVMGHRKVLLKLLFEASAYTLNKFGSDPKFLGAKPGFVSVLHTWGQQLSFHPHVHCIVSGGGIDTEGNWVAEKRKKHNFLFPIQAVKKVYKAYFMKQLRVLKAKGEIDIEGFDELLKIVGYKKWMVYAKRPFAGPQQVLEYLGRYTQKSAISKHRVLEVTDTHVRFSYKDYKVKDPKKMYKEMCLSIAEFCRRLELHFLPKHFVRTRHFGFLYNRKRRERVNKIRQTLNLPALPPREKHDLWVRVQELTGKDIRQCPYCGIGTLMLIDVVHLYDPYADSILNKDPPDFSAAFG